MESGKGEKKNITRVLAVLTWMKTPIYEKAPLQLTLLSRTESIAFRLINPLSLASSVSRQISAKSLAKLYILHSEVRLEACLASGGLVSFCLSHWGKCFQGSSFFHFLHCMVKPQTLCLFSFLPPLLWLVLVQERSTKT